MKRNVPKYKHKCIDGPFAGGDIWLSMDGTTAVFTVKSFKGRYVRYTANTAKWEAA